MGAYGGTSEASRSPSDWSLTADTNNNGIVNLTDYAIFCGYFSQTDENLPGDFNHDGVVNVVDLTYLTADWLEITTWYIP